LYQQAVRDDPKDLSARRSLAGNFYAIGSLLDDDATAIPLFDAAIAGFREVQKESPGSAPEVGWRTALKYRAEAADRLGNTALALDSAEQLKQIAEGLLKTSPDNFTARADRYRAFSLMGEAWEIRGGKSGSAADRRQAESWFQQALDGYSALEKKAALSRTDKAAVTRSRQALARLRAAH
jgi:tetratricopeptide (TPR) repeat protein